MRLAPLPADEWDDQVRDALGVLLPPERINAADAGNLLTTLVRNPALARAYLKFSTYVLRDSTLSPRVREIVVLRTVHRRNCSYLWSHHIPIAQRAGLTLDEIAGIRRGEAANDFDRAVLQAVDEVEDQAVVSDNTWEALGGQLDDRQRMDLIFAAGCYGLLGAAVNTFGVQGENPNDSDEHVD